MRVGVSAGDARDDFPMLWIAGISALPILGALSSRRGAVGARPGKIV